MKGATVRVAVVLGGGKLKLRRMKEGDFLGAGIPGTGES